jgi:hypothetical protein
MAAVDGIENCAITGVIPEPVKVRIMLQPSA